jgi:hypothetical protein
MTIKAQVPADGIRTVHGQRVAVHRMARRGDDLVRVEVEPAAFPLQPSEGVLELSREAARALAKRLTASAK